MSLNILSLGAGVQSTALALMAEEGAFKIDHAIFADTHGEPESVYEQLSWLQNNITEYPIHKVSAGNLEEAIFSGERFASIPFYLRNEDESIGMGRRQCTREYKIAPVYKKIRELAGLRPYERPNTDFKVYLYMGISIEEAVKRMRKNEVKWIINTYPLVDKYITRDGCIKWLKERGYPLPQKSSCFYCPFHSNAHWKTLRDNDPEIFEKAVKFDAKLRDPEYITKFNSKQYLHRLALPLAEAVEASANTDQGNFGFEDECEGMCGV